MEEYDFKLILKNRTFTIPNNFGLLTDIDSIILEILINNRQYEVKSNVHEDVFQAFVSYLLKGILPSFCEKNISEFDLLSQEFDIMKNLIQIYKKHIPQREISSLIIHNTELQSQIHQKRNKLNEKVQNNRQILHFIFTNGGLNDKTQFLKSKINLFKACQAENVQKVDILTRKKIVQNGVTFIINQQDRTAAVARSKEAKGNIFIPRSIEWDNSEYVVKSISEKAFHFNGEIKSVNFHSNSELQVICDNAFAESSIEEISIPSSVKEIGIFAFNFCESLEKVEFSEDSQLNSIKESTFSYTSIKNIAIPRNVKQIGENAFYCCSKLSTIHFSKDSQLKIIDNYAFAESVIEEITVPSRVKEIRACAFFYCHNLTKVDFSENSELNLIEKEAFCNSSIKSITIPSGVEKIGEGCFSLTSQLNDIKVAECKEKNFSCYKGNLILGKSDIKSDTFDVLFLARRDIKVVSVPSYIKEISPYAFIFCHRIQKVEFSDDSKLISLGKHSFSNSSLSSILFPSSVTNVGEYAFYQCTRLEKVEFKDNSKKTSISKFAFGATGISSIAIHQNVWQIDQFAFSYCKNLKLFEIPENSMLKSFNIDTFKGSPNVIITFPVNWNKLN